MNEVTEAEFQDAYIQFDNAIHTMIGLRPDTIHLCKNADHDTTRKDCDCAGTRITFSDPIYTQIRHELEGLSGDQGRGVNESRPPVWVDGLDWLNKVDGKVEEWTPGWEGGTASRLDELSRATWAPAKTAWLRKATNSIVAWVNEALTLLQGEEERRLDVVAPCPHCHVQTVVRKDSGGDMVRKTALQLAVSGCVCLACGDRWDQDHLDFLAELIGCVRKELA